MYFENDDEVRKKIRGVFMGKVDCIVEMREETYNEGCNDTLMKVASSLLEKGYLVEEICSITDLSVSEVMNLKSEIK